MKQTILIPAQVRQFVDSHNDGSKFLVDRVAKQLGISRRRLFDYLRDGVTIDVPEPTRAILEAAGVEIVTKPKK